MFLQWIALIGFLVIGLIFASELRRWRTVDSVIGGRQRLLRVWLLVLIEALFVMMFIGPWVTNRQDPVSALLYWTVCFALGFAIMILALLDLREVGKRYSELNRQLFRDLRDNDERGQ